MAQITLPPRKSKYVRKFIKNNPNKVKSAISKEISKMRNKQIYVKMRNQYLMEHPLCEICLQHGKTSPTTEIHHRIPISEGKTMEEREALCYDYENLQALCFDCHHKIHIDMMKSKRNRQNLTKMGDF